MKITSFLQNSAIQCAKICRIMQFLSMEVKLIEEVLAEQKEEFALKLKTDFCKRHLCKPLDSSGNAYPYNRQ